MPKINIKIINPQKYAKLITTDGYVAKRKAKKIHTCINCSSDIPINTEYYNANRRDGDGFYHSIAICEECWQGYKMTAKNKAHYNENGEYANIENVMLGNLIKTEYRSGRY